MTCEDYLSMLESLPVEELAYGAARDHAAQCHDCNRVTRVVAARERNMVMAYAEAYPSAAAVTVAERAIATSRRRRIALYVRFALGAVAAVVVAGIFASRRVLPSPTVVAVPQETFRLQCLSPDQAAELLRQEIPAATLSIRARPPLGVLHVEGSPLDLQIARSIIDRYDSPARSQCAVDVKLPKP
ncbi:MAG TPA: hypothetical protein VIP11_21380 [Gemmatimonadaceae bacterium]